MSVYMILDAEVHDAEAYERYKEAAPQYVARHGVNIVVEAEILMF